MGIYYYSFMILGRKEKNEKDLNLKIIDGYEFLMESKYKFKTIDPIFEAYELKQGFVEHEKLSKEHKDHISKFDKNNLNWFVVQCMFTTYDMGSKQEDKIDKILQIQ